MARVDWFAFLRQHNIPYTTTGPNASRGRVNIKCPFCSNDPSEHMGISIRGKGWSCWRNSSHSGRTPQRLIAALLKCSLEDAERYVDGSVPLPADRDIGSTLRERLSGGVVRPKLRALTLPNEFKPLDNGSRFADQFLRYLRFRGYRANQLDWLIETYELHYALDGRFAYRIIIPIRERWGELQTWTARTILEDEELRYKTLRSDEQLCSPKETLLGLPLLWRCSNPKVLLVCEGPFDAFWITAYGRAFGVYATCLFGLTLSSQQAQLLLELRERFPRQALVLDSAARFQSFKLAQSGLDLGVVSLPDDVKDPADLSSGKVVDLCVGLI